MRGLVPGLLALVTGATLSAAPAQAQSLLPCATPPPSAAEQVRLLQLSLSPVVARPSGAVTNLPVRLNIIRRSDGSGGADVVVLLRALAETNFRFRNANVQFYACGQVRYINSDQYYDFDYHTDDSALGAAYDQSGVINIYSTKNINVGGFGSAGGYAIGQRVLLTNGMLGDHNLVQHELGHVLGLPHTFFNSNHADVNQRELVARTNCQTTGDLVCDTPADPYERSGATQHECGYTGTITDANGAAYAPAMRNSMAYWGCGNVFTPGQLARMDAYRTAYLNNLGCSTERVKSPTGLSANNLGRSGVKLDWNDQADNEVGYFIERGLSMNGDYVTIGATGPAGVTFVDASPPAQQTVYYRVKPINSVDEYSNRASVTSDVTYCRPEYANSNCLPDLPVYLSAFQVSEGEKVLLTRPSVAGCGSYLDFTAGQDFIMVGGRAYSAQLKLFVNASNQYYPQYTAIWIDLNRNGDFTDAGEQVFRGTDGQQQQQTTFTLPKQLTPGTSRMRVRTRYISGGPLDEPCDWAAYGATEDYAVQLRDPDPLPVELVAFEARAQAGGVVRTEWRTASEKQNDRFEVERALDGRTFERIGTVAGRGTSSSPINYAFTDAAAAHLPRPLYYRLRQIDDDGTSSLSQVRVVAGSGNFAVGLFPTFTQGAVTLDLRSLPPAACTAEVVDLSGRVITAWELTGGVAHNLSVHQLRQGTYMVRLSAKGLTLPSLRLLKW
ncbi:GEVED domain-containing protein [Hymenobacter latericus]|uniref:GEVED domain-containing protein n=1 Tax=Hymenobacter sp. YIM 151858-1 TaxID=2987688 RepID=UPI0022266264|nr:GEVED domain-containing protein [Hymenobacter sp. YIM 151858-1]UYZ57763.1 GEVED domain-containing protein [Hymenobacter sp. YIM 151858-1]